MRAALDVLFNTALIPFGLISIAINFYFIGIVCVGVIHPAPYVPAHGLSPVILVPTVGLPIGVAALGASLRSFANLFRRERHSI